MRTTHRYLFVFLIQLQGLTLLTANAQECPCCHPEYRQFDFWLGDWIVYDSLDNEVGRNTIVSGQNGCLLVENWTSSSGGTGTSYNYYNRIDSTWNQVWVDASGGVLELKGAFKEGAMLLQSARQQGSDGSSISHRITWESDGDQVIQTWETLDESNRVRSLLFKGYYRRE